MILSLRQRHRLLMFSLAIILPVAFVAALFVRQPIPATPELPVNFPPLSNESWRLVFEKDDLWPGLPISTRLYSNRQSDTLLTLELQPRENLKTPDILVYCHPAFSASLNQLPERAQLLGTLAGMEKRWFMLPLAKSEQETAIMLYSLAHQKIIAAIKLPAAASFIQGETP